MMVRWLLSEALQDLRFALTQPELNQATAQILPEVGFADVLAHRCEELAERRGDRAPLCWCQLLRNPPNHWRRTVLFEKEFNKVRVFSLHSHSPLFNQHAKDAVRGEALEGLRANGKLREGSLGEAVKASLELVAGSK